MPKYRLLIRGENFLMNLDGKAQRLGFYTTVFLEAAKPDKAEYAAMDFLRNDRWVKQALLNDRGNPPMMYHEEIEELRTFRGRRPPRTGFTWFSDKSPRRKARKARPK